jgi:lipoate-protein ligase B
MIAAHVRLGRMPYDEATEIQRRMHDLRMAGRVPDVLLTVEHEPVFTRGRSARSASFRASPDEIASAGIAVRDTERGGDVTYHGPGQLVVYPILNLRAWDRDVKAHVKRLEEAAIRTLAGYGIAAARCEGFPGVWTERGKIASVGVSVRRWVTMHGLALNVAVDPSHFAMINPCGLPVRAVSMNDTLVPPARLGNVEAEFCRVYGELLGVRWGEAELSTLVEATHV